ncbi:hypothetical protein ACQ4PT_007470 [Festuca glaucescens]
MAEVWPLPALNDLTSSDSEWLLRLLDGRTETVETKQHSPPIPNIKQRSSNQKENKVDSFGESHSVMMKMGSVLSASLKNIWKNQFKGLDLPELSSDFIPGQQEYAHEFLRCLLDNLNKCTLDPKSKGKPSFFHEESIVKQVFGGQLKSHLTCRDCGQFSETFEPFLDLSLEIDQVDDLVATLESFTKVEQIGDAENKLTCKSCNGQFCKDKQLVLDKSPYVVAFQLKRFTTLDGSIEKIDKHVAYPSELDLKPFHSNPDKEDLRYDLYGVVEHSGLPNFGHYVCTICSSPSSWHLMNDSLVDSITETSALHQEAYMLFYVRQGMFPWFSGLLEEDTSGAYPVSVLDNIDVVMRCAPSAIEITNPERPSTPPPRPKRMYSVYDHNVFAFENLGKDLSPIIIWLS